VPDDTPFFLVGCVRSGTTLVRDLLREHPRLACPEETHYFRWPHPFGNVDFMGVQESNEVLRQHRHIDGVGDATYADILASATTRRDLQDRYAEAFLQAGGMSARRWFDKTPQNVYGLLLLSAVYPEARFVHIHRHPFNVVASLMAGKVMARHSLIGAINTWLESVAIVQQFSQAWPDRVLDVSYERLTGDPLAEINRLLAFLGEAPLDQLGAGIRVHPEQNRHLDALNDADRQTIRHMLGERMRPYGYD
jgi:hypothetical protein